MLLSYRIFSKKKMSSVLLVIQFIVSLLLLNLMVGNVNFVTFTNQAFSKIAEMPGYFYMPVNMDSRGYDDYQKMKERLKGDSRILTIAQYWFQSEFDGETFFYGYDDDLYRAYTPEMEKGEWIHEGTGEDTYLPLVISEEFGPYQYGTEFESILLLSGDEIPVKVKITGVMKRPGMYLDFNVTGSDIATNHLFRNHKAEYSGAPMFFINKVQLPVHQEGFANLSSIIFFDEDLNEDDVNFNLETLSERGDISSLSDIQMRGEEYAQGYVILYLPLFLCGFSISFIGMVGLSILNVQKNLRNFSIYYFLGCKWKKVAEICLGVTVIQLVITTVLLGIVFFYVQLNINLALYGVILNQLNIRFTLFVYLFVGLITYFVPKITLARNSAMDMFRINLQA